MIYIVDTHAWIEYFLGSKYGLILKKLIGDRNNKLITMECSLAELWGYCSKNNVVFNRIYDIVKRNSFVLPVLTNHWIKAAKIRFEMRRKVKDFGLIDAILVAKQNELKCAIVSGDPHFKSLKNVVYIGEK